MAVISAIGKPLALVWRWISLVFVCMWVIAMVCHLLPNFLGRLAYLQWRPRTSHCVDASMESPLDHISSLEIATITKFAKLKLFTADLVMFFKELLKVFPPKDGPVVPAKELGFCSRSTESMGTEETNSAFLERGISPSLDRHGERPDSVVTPGNRSIGLNLTVENQRPAPKRSFQHIDLQLSLYSSRQNVAGISPPLSCQPLQTPSYCSTAPSASPAELLAAMANFPVDPTPYIPEQYQLLQVANRPQQCRYHVTDGIRAKHEDVAISTVTPAPGDAILVGLVRNMLRNLIEIQFGFNLEMIQRCPIGTPYVRFSSFADRDWLVSRSPHHFAGRTISFVNHNEGINHRAFTYNQECWLLLVAYPLDLWSTEHIKRAVKDFGVFVAWDEEASSYGAIVVKVRVAAYPT
ncbi:hypothetical protein ACQ4PT_012261 [Festuca glaucescens]